ncbi:MAG: hypothetical protein QY318_02300 [Candidatus Dojkabacteria bacterium]|nr:MAG: hypothetical protein QY318_02300 [Candidatus Dojkabacteria bacterium]
MYNDPAIANLLEPTGTQASPGEPANSRDIAKFFIKRGYEVMGINQIWKSVTGHLKKDGVEYYLKLANSGASSELIKNEISWNETIHKLATEKGFDRLIVPGIEDQGEYEGSVFFLTKYYFGTPLANKNYTKVGDIAKYADTIIDIAHLINDGGVVPLSIDSQHKQKDGLKEHEMQGFLNVAKGYAAEIKENDMAPLLAIVDEYQKAFDFSLCHNSFEPKEMIPEGDKIVLIDAEQASAYSPKYYDIAYFFTKTYVAGRLPDVAKDLIRKFKEKLSDDEKSAFDGLVRPSIALSAIHCFLKSEQDGNHFFEYHNKFLEEFKAGLPY